MAYNWPSSTRVALQTHHGPKKWPQLDHLQPHSNQNEKTRAQKRRAQETRYLYSNLGLGLLN